MKGINIPIFRCAVDVQEYHDSFVKIAARRTAFYQGAGVANSGSIDGSKYGGIAVRVPEIALFGVAREAPLRFPKVTALLAEHRAVAFEIDELIQHANLTALPVSPICTPQRAGVSSSIRKPFVGHRRRYGSPIPDNGLRADAIEQVSRSFVNHDKSSAFLVSPRRHQGRAMEMTISLNGA